LEALESSRRAKEDMNFEIIQPTLEDAKKVWSLRSDSEARNNSLTFRDEMSVDEFYPKFIEKYFTIAFLPSLFINESGQVIAVLRFNREEEGVEISIVIAQEMRGKGKGYQILEAIKPWLKRNGVHKVVAKIKEDNKASIAIFEKSGYKKASREGDLFTYILPLSESSNRVFFIAEAGSNWKIGENDWERVLKLVDVAADAGADAVKFQVFRAENTYAPNAGVADYLNEDIHSLFKHLEMPYEWIPKIAEYCKEKGIEWMASPFSLEDFKMIDPYVKRHKIASYENHHLRLLEAVAQTKKPVYVSTGASNLVDIAATMQYLQGLRSGPITLLQCSAAYPAPDESMNLNAIVSLRDQFQVPVGLSDHSLDPFIAPLAAVALGATVIERHFTLDRNLKGPDHKFATEPNELKQLIKRIRELEKMKGSGFKKVEPSEKELYHFAKRRLQAIKAIKRGELLEEGVNFAILRPGKNSVGKDPFEIGKIQGVKAEKDYQIGEGI
jgi:N-acetylneuraminate synthase